MSTNVARGRQHGLTMIELLMFIVIVGVAVAGILSVLSYTSRNSADPQLRKQALAIGEGLLDEVMAAHFTFCHVADANAETAASSAGCAAAVEAIGPLAGERRPYYNVNDYVSAFNTPASFTAGDSSGVITDANGNDQFSGLYTAKVTVTPEAVLGPAASLIPAVAAPANAADTNALHVSVDVSYGKNEHIILDGYRTRYAPNALP